MTSDEFQQRTAEVLVPFDEDAAADLVERARHRCLDVENFLCVGHLLRHLVLDGHWNLARRLLEGDHWLIATEAFRAELTLDFVASVNIVKCVDGDEEPLLSFLKQQLSTTVRIDLLYEAIRHLPDSPSLRELLPTAYGLVSRQELVDRRSYPEMREYLLARYDACKFLPDPK